MPDLLLEIGLEEVPARMLPAAQAELLKRTLALLTREQLIGSDPIAHAYSTPRRLAVLIHGVAAQQADITEDTTGPAVKIAFKDGQPTPAAEAFARKSGVAVADLRTVTTPKGDYLAATTVKRGRPAAEVLAAELPKEIAALYWAKNMYWRPGKPERFVRPVLWLACLLDDTIVPLEFAGKTANRLTYGHRILHGDRPITIDSPTTYLAQLESAHVLADVELRRHKIRKALDHVTRTVPGLRWREDHALVDAVTHLTEWPDVLLGTFEPAYLTLPEEVLVTVMRDHQKYFAVEDATGKLAPCFLTVTNIALDEINTPIIKQGNERVLRARFNDARFFWDFDQKIKLEDRVKLLENVTFQKDLGSYAAKSERIRNLALKISNTARIRGIDANDRAIAEAVKLAKTDLTTELVKEFTELQGKIGGLYALSQGSSVLVSNAIYDQYTPASTKDALPRSLEGSILGVADRMDTIAGMFSLGMEPTGSKDPFALRRAANAIVRILGETSLEVTLSELVAMVPSKDMNVHAAINKFLLERLSFYLREIRGQAYDVVNAVMGADGHQVDDVKDAVARAEAISPIKNTPNFMAVCDSFKRVKNILAQAKEKGINGASSVGKLYDSAEIALYQQLKLKAEGIENLRIAREYAGALDEVSEFGPLLKEFFEQVMVMTDQEDVRATRLKLLSEVCSEFALIADFSEIVTSA